MEKEYKSCQSCGMPFKHEKDHGTNSDGSLSKKYCSYCYANGAFTQPTITSAEMQLKVKAQLKSMGWFHGLFAGLFAKGIPKLERWKNN